MATPDELRGAIESARETFRSAVEAASSSWEQSPGGEEWSPRQAAEHTVGVEYAYARAAAETMQSRAPDRPELSFASAADALAAEDTAADASNRVLRYIEAGDLRKKAPMSESLEGVMQSIAGHLGEHTEQISSA